MSKKMNRKVQASLVVAILLGITLCSITTNANRNHQNPFGVDWVLTYTPGLDMNYEGGLSVDTLRDQSGIASGFIELGYNSDSEKTTLIKTDNNGNILHGWPKIISGQLYFIEQTDDNGDGIQNEGYIIVGQKLGRLFLVKLDASGEMVWNHTFTNGVGSIGLCIQQSYNYETHRYDGYIITGSIGLFPDQPTDILVLKTDRLGNTIWKQVYDGYRLQDFGKSVQQTQDGGYIVAGNLGENEIVAIYDCCLLKYDQNGNLEHVWIYGEPGNIDIARSVHQTNEGDYILTGTTNNGVPKAWLIKQYANGDPAWIKTYSEAIEAFSVDICSEGGYIIAGYRCISHPGYDDYDVSIIKTDDNGNVEFSDHFGGIDTDEFGYAIQEISQGEYIIAGKIGYYAYEIVWKDSDHYLLKINENN